METVSNPGADIDWFRQSPVVGMAGGRIPLPYPDATPTISMFGATTIQSER